MTNNERLTAEVKKALDGRTVRSVSFKTMIAESDFSRLMNGKIEWTEKHIDKINNALGSNIVFEEQQNVS